MKHFAILLFAIFSLAAYAGDDFQSVDGLAATDIDFGDVPIGTIKSSRGKIMNIGSTAITINGLKITGADSSCFNYENNIPFPFDISPGQSIEIAFKFSPAIAKPFQTQVEIDYNHYKSPCIFILRANSIVSVGDQSENFFTLSPNPASDFIEINNFIPADAGILNNSVKIYNFLGEIVFNDSATPPGPLSRGGVTRIDVSGLVPGIYFVRVGDSVQRFVKY